MMDSIATVCAVLFVASVSYLMLASFALGYMVDEEKLRALPKPSKAMRGGMPSREILTPLGTKVWWSRWLVLAIAVVCLVIAVNFRPVN